MKQAVDSLGHAAGVLEPRSGEVSRRSVLGGLASERVWGADQALAFVRARHELSPLTAFQCAAWLERILDHWCDDTDGAVSLVVVRDTASGAIGLVMPLVVVEERGVRVAGFPDYGVSDYSAPLIGPAWSQCVEAFGQLAIWRAVLDELADVDLLSLQSVPASFGPGMPDLSLLGRQFAAQHMRNIVTLSDGVDAFLRERGKKYRKEVERCRRLLDRAGPVELRVAEGAAEVQAAFEALTSLQSRRWDHDESYRLDEAHLVRFYRDALEKSAGEGEALIFTLAVGRQVIAVLYGLLWRDSFTLLRIASDTDNWSRVSPGRIMVIEVMRHFAQKGVTTFDLGIGEYAFKRGIGARSEALIDVEKALSLRGIPSVVLMQAKALLRRNPRLFRLAKRLRDGVG